MATEKRPTPTAVTSEWRGSELWWTINGDEVSDTNLRAWIYRNLDGLDRHVDVIRQVHVDAFASRRASLSAAPVEPPPTKDYEKEAHELVERLKKVFHGEGQLWQPLDEKCVSDWLRQRDQAVSHPPAKPLIPSTHPPCKCGEPADNHDFLWGDCPYKVGKYEANYDCAPAAPAKGVPRAPHVTRPVRVWADIDCGIADLVERLNTIPDVRTDASCEGEALGPNPYPAYVMVHWATKEAELALRRVGVLKVEGEQWGYIHPQQETGHD